MADHSRLTLVGIDFSGCDHRIYATAVSVEDASKCKRPVSVLGIEVKVKRVVVKNYLSSRSRCMLIISYVAHCPVLRQEG